MRIILDTHSYNEAIRLGEEMHRSIGNSETSKNGYAVANRFIVGMIGEFAFAAFLDLYGVRYDWQPKADGKSDSKDFALYSNGKKLIIDVKTLSTHSDRLLLFEREYEKIKANGWRVVFCEIIKENKVEILGVANHTNFYLQEVNGLGKRYVCMLSELKAPSLIVTYSDKR